MKFLCQRSPSPRSRGYCKCKVFSIQKSICVATDVIEYFYKREFT